MSQEEKWWRVVLRETRGIGDVRMEHLVRVFGSAKGVFEAGESEWKKMGVGAGVIENLKAQGREVNPKSYGKWLEKREIRVLVNGLDEDYPEFLAEMDKPPQVLYVRGKTEVLKKIGVAVVGTRKPTEYGKQVTRQIAGQLAEQGIVIVSGLALGVDSVAHEAALMSGGETAAVLGSGIMKVTPTSHEGLARRIVKLGALVSTYPPNEGAQPGYFVARNRWIAGLAQAVLVTEGADGSGAGITAKHGLEQDKPVLVVPGPITSGMSVTPNKLLRDGAVPVFGAEDVLEAVGQKNSSTKLLDKVPEFVNELHAKIWDELEKGSVEMDVLVAELGVGMSELGVALTEMEMEGWVERAGREWRRGG